MNTDKTQNKRPDFLAYHVKSIGVDNSKWTQLGAAWKHADGEGYNLILDSLSVDGRLTLRVPKADDQSQAEPS